MPKDALAYAREHMACAVVLVKDMYLSLARILQGSPSRVLLKLTLIVFAIGLFVQHLPSTCLFR